MADAIVAGCKAVQRAWDNLDPGLKQWIINGVSLAVGFIPLVGPLLSCVIDGTFVDMFSAIMKGDWAMVGMCALAFVPGVGAAGKLMKTGLRSAEKVVGKSSRLVSKADDLVKVRHYTNAEGKKLIEASGRLKKGSYVTAPSEISHGMSPSQIEKALEITPGKGEYYVDLTVSRSKLGIPSSGPLTSGGKAQWQITEDVPLGSAKFSPSSSW